MGGAHEIGQKYPKDPALLKTLRVVNHCGDSNYDSELVRTVVGQKYTISCIFGLFRGHPQN